LALTSASDFFRCFTSASSSMMRVADANGLDPAVSGVVFGLLAAGCARTGGGGLGPKASGRLGIERGMGSSRVWVSTRGSPREGGASLGQADM
jgi:hypothetical protein